MGRKTLGIGAGSSSIKASLYDLETGETSPIFKSPRGDVELKIDGEGGFASQDPEVWWDHMKDAILDAVIYTDDPIEAIGFSYQMHGLVPIDAEGNYLDHANIWCDSRTAAIKKKFEDDPSYRARFLEQCLNLPGHFTAAKAAWLKENKPGIWERVDKILLPGHYLARRMTGEATTTASGLSEGVLWDFKHMHISDLTLEALGIPRNVIPEIRPTFGVHGKTIGKMDSELGLRTGTPITFMGGDQPVTALSLNVLRPGEFDATAGTSAVIYGVTDKVIYDPKTRVNAFLHLNSSTADHSNPRIGVLACINGAGIAYRWLRDMTKGNYKEMDRLADSVESNGLYFVPFGNGAERIQEDTNTGGALIGISYKNTTQAHLYRAALEGIAYAMRQGIEVMRSMGMDVNRIRVGDANLFKSTFFRQQFADAMQVTVDVYNTDESAGAARGAAVGLGAKTLDNIFDRLQTVAVVEPRRNTDTQYAQWLDAVERVKRR